MTVQWGPNGEPLGYPNLADEILEQQVIPDVGNVMFVRAYTVPDGIWNLQHDLPSDYANKYPDDLANLDRFAVFNGQVGAQLYNIPLLNALGAVDYVLSDASLSVQSYTAPEGRFIDQVS